MADDYERLAEKTELTNEKALALKKEMKQMIAESRGFDNERYIALMKKLPEID